MKKFKITDEWLNNATYKIYLRNEKLKNIGI